MTFYAHSANLQGRGSQHRLKDHLEGVSALAGASTSGWCYQSETRLAALLHDVGKYGDLFQRRLKGQESGLDHWSQGTWLACVEHKSVAAALAIQGHHLGLQSLAALYKSIPRGQPGPGSYPEQLRLSEPDVGLLKQRLAGDGLAIPPFSDKLPLNRRVDAMLDLRRLFSALVDADYLDTEAHFNGNVDGKCYRPPAPTLNPENALVIVEEHLDRLRKASAAHPLQALRDQLLGDCLTAACAPRGLYTLTAPTGSGKTLAMLAYALKHAAKHHLRRVVLVIPYLTIIEQTARIYREIFQPHFGEHYVLEHHSLAGLGAETANSDAEETTQASAMGSAQRRRQQQTENWDAPLVVTTSVQMLESLFSNRPSACRKLHRLADSVILFDEVQTLPTTLAVPTLAALSHLVSGWGSTVVFATATQPAFDAPAIHGQVSKHCAAGWQPGQLTEVDQRAVPPRVKWEWRHDMPMDAALLANHLVDAPNGQSLSVLNTKRQARELFEAMTETSRATVRHLSTNLCPLHRDAVLKEVRQNLNQSKPVHLVATQCIEAGVDVDFPAVWRAFAPLDALIQAAGRCNRNGFRADGGRMVVFAPSENRYPDRGYEQAAQATAALLSLRPETRNNPEAPENIRAYYELLYGLRNLDMPQAMTIAISNLDFAEMAKEYRLIKQDAINVLVPYAGAMTLYNRLHSEAQQQGIQGRWMREARGLIVSMFRPKPDDRVWDSLVALQERQRGQVEISEDWFTVSKPSEHYHVHLGLDLPKALNLYIA